MFIKWWNNLESCFFFNKNEFVVCKYFQTAENCFYNLLIVWRICWQFFLAKFFEEFFWRIFLTIIFNVIFWRFFWRILLTIIFDEFFDEFFSQIFWRIFWQNFFDKFFDEFFLSNFAVKLTLTPPDGSVIDFLTIFLTNFDFLVDFFDL